MLLERLAKEEYDWEDLQRLVRKGNLPSQKDIINTVTKEYTFLKDLNDPLPKIIKDSKAHHEQDLVNAVLSNLNKNAKA